MASYERFDSSSLSLLCVLLKKIKKKFLKSVSGRSHPNRFFSDRCRHEGQNDVRKLSSSLNIYEHRSSGSIDRLTCAYGPGFTRV